MTRRAAALLVTLVLPMLAGCAAEEQGPLRVSTTTSLQATGLLDVLLPAFGDEAGIASVYVAVGTGQAMEHGRRGDADLVLVHAPAREETFVADGHGTRRYTFARNFFAIAGRAGDAVEVGRAANATAAFRAIHDAEATFVSRGDDSGTHARERELWRVAGFDYAVDIAAHGVPWYLSAGSGMAETLRVASEKQGYTLTDTGTFWALADRLDLVLLLTGTEDLRNVYTAIPVSDAMVAGVRTDDATRLAEWLRGARAQALIAGVKVGDHTLFEPYAP